MMAFEEMVDKLIFDTFKTLFVSSDDIKSYEMRLIRQYGCYQDERERECESEG
jgi:hypothetical protein